MIPKQYKFRRRFFEVLMRKMKPFRHGDFLMLYRVSDRPSFAVVISKKVTKKAVGRNRFRRQVYSLMEEHLLKKGLSVQVIALYKGRQIPENAQGAREAVEDFAKFLERKSTPKTNT